MDNKFVIKRGYISQGDSQITGSLTVTQGITGSLQGTASFAVSSSTAISSSFTQTASFAFTAVTASYALNSGESIDTGSLLITASVESNTITFTKGDGSTFPITVNTGSGGGGSVSGGVLSGSFGITIDGAGSSITTGNKGYVTIPYAGTITGWTMIADQSGNCVIDVWKTGSGNIPTVADTITGTEKPTLSSQQINSNLTLTSWTTSVLTGDIIAFNVDSTSLITRINLSVYITKQ